MNEDEQWRMEEWQNTPPPKSETMSLQDVKDSISITQHWNERGYYLVAKFKVTASIMVDNSYHNRNELSIAKECLKETIIRKLYEDQRKKLYESVMDFLKWSHPIDHDKYMHARDRLMDAASRQPK